MRPEEKSVTKEKTGEIAIFVFISDLCSSPVSCKICYVETVGGPPHINMHSKPESTT